MIHVSVIEKDQVDQVEFTKTALFPFLIISSKLTKNRNENSSRNFSLHFKFKLILDSRFQIITLSVISIFLFKP